MFWRANSCWLNRVSFPIVLLGTKSFYTLIQAKHRKTKTNVQNYSSPRSKTQDVSGIGCVCQQAQLICVANLLWDKFEAKKTKDPYSFLLEFFSTHFASLGGEKCEQKTWKALKVKLMISLVIEHVSFLPSWSPVAYNLYQWVFLRQILLTKNWESFGNVFLKCKFD